MYKRFSKFHFLLKCAFIGFIPLSALSKVNLQIQGIKDSKLNDNVNLYVKMINKEEADGSLRYQGLIRDAIDKGLRAYGYYHSDVEFELSSKGKGKKDTLIAKVSLGEPVKIAGTEVNILGKGQQDKSFQNLLKKLPKTGSILNHEVYDNYKNDLQKLALNRGYFDADFKLSRLEVMPSTHQAWWRLIFNSGERYSFGEVNFINSQIREDYLRNMISIEENEPYLISKLSSLTQNYNSSNWFSSVLLQPQIDNETKRVNVDVFLQPRKKNILDLGGGWASDVGPRLKLNWQKPWINSRGHSLNTSLYVSQPKQTLATTYKLPLLKNPLNYYYEMSLGLENETLNDTKVFSSTFSSLRYWNHPTGWQYSLGLQARYDSFEQGSFRNKTLLIYPTTSIHRTRLKGGLFPTWGDSQRLSFDIGRRFFISDVDFLRLHLSSAWIRTFADNHRFITRFEFGWLKTSNLDKIPPNLRFFAGGDRGIRGYGYKTIAPKNKKGQLIGGARLLTGSLEYQYQVYPNWWAAGFADAGLSANSFNPKKLHYGAGMGIRWASPVGAVKFDIATPIRDKKANKNIQFYIGLGAEL